MGRSWSLQFGDASTNDPHIRGPHYFNEDFSVTKAITVTDQYSLNSRARWGIYLTVPVV